MEVLHHRYDDPDASYTQLYKHRNKKLKMSTQGSVTPISSEGSSVPALSGAGAKMEAIGNAYDSNVAVEDVVITTVCKIQQM